MANVSSSNGIEKYPKLRFPEFSESWNDTVFDSIIQMHDEKVFGEHSYEVLTSSREGLQRQSEHFGTEQRHDTDGYNIIQLGYCTYRNRSDDGFFTFNVNNAFPTGIVSKFYPVFKFVGANSTFMTEYLNNSISNKKKLSILAVGTSQVVLSISALRSASFCIPHKKEQDKLASFIELLNIRIVKQHQLVEHLKKYKRGLHDRIFSHLSNSECEKTDLRSIATFCGGGTPSKDIPSYWDGNIGWISSSDIHEEWVDTISVTRRINELAINNSATKLCPSGTIAIVSRVGVGKVALMSEDLCTSQDFTNITSIMGNTLFMTYQIAYKMKIEAAKTQGTSIKGITAEEIKSLKIDIPADEEQRYIATLLSSLDIRLRQEKREADCLRTLKKALLQQLFI